MQKTYFPVIWAMFYLRSINIPLKYRKAERKSNLPAYKSWKWNLAWTWGVNISIPEKCDTGTLMMAWAQQPSLPHSIARNIADTLLGHCLWEAEHLKSTSIAALWPWIHWVVSKVSLSPCHLTNPGPILAPNQQLTHHCRGNIWLKLLLDSY